MTINFLEPKLCAYCNGEFTPKRKNQTYCKETCKTYASQVRTGRRSEYRPPPVIGALTIETQNELKQKVDTMRAELESKREIHEGINEYPRWHYPAELKGQPQSVKKEYNKNLTDEINLLNITITETLFNITPVNTKDTLRKPSEINKNKKYKPVYDFIKFCDEGNTTATQLTGLGVLPYPFIFYLYTDYHIINNDYHFDNEEAHVFLGLIACKMCEAFNPKILFLGHNKGNYDYVLKYLERKNKENIFFIESENRAEIEKAIKESDVTFLFILNALHFPIDYDFVKNLQQINNKLSVFVSSEKPIQSFIKNADVAIKPNDEKIINYSYNGDMSFNLNTGSETPLFFTEY